MGAVALVAAAAAAVAARVLLTGGDDGPPAPTGPDLPPGPAVLAAQDVPGQPRLSGPTTVVRGVDPTSGDGFEIRLPAGKRKVADGTAPDVTLLAAVATGGGMVGLARLDEASARALIGLAGDEAGPVRASAVGSLPAWSREEPFGARGTRRMFAFEHEDGVFLLEYYSRGEGSPAALNSALAAIQTFRWTS